MPHADTDSRPAKPPEKKKRTARFLDYIWDVELASLSRYRRAGVKAFRVVHLMLRGFRDDACALHASALTLSTLMAIVPVLALTLTLARGFGNVELARQKMQSVVVEWTQGFGAREMTTNALPGTLPEAAPTEGEPPAGTDSADFSGVITHLVDKVFNKVEKISFKALGWVGLVLLIWTVIDVLWRVELAFNSVWGVIKGRTLWRRFTDYLTVVVILPVLLIAASSLPIVDIAGRFLDRTVFDGIRILGGSAVLKYLTVIVMTTLAFSFVIMFMPNTRVKPLPGLAGGSVAAVLFVVWLGICAALQVGVASYGKIYGGFAAVPIALACIFVSWEIVLLGGEVAFAVQNCATYRMEQVAGKASFNARVALALSILTEAGRAVSGKQGGFNAETFAGGKRIPIRFMNDVMEDLVQAGLLAELTAEKGVYALMRAPDSLAVREVVDVVLNSGEAAAAVGMGNMDAAIEGLLRKVNDGVEGAFGKMTIKDLAGAEGREKI